MPSKVTAGLLETLRKKKPLVLHITNYVTVNDCANITLAVGASPVMAHADEEVADMVGLTQALVLNIGTCDRAQLRSMFLAGTRANQLGIPIILDPVGAGATKFRTEISQLLLRDLKIAILKGNGGEISVLAGAKGKVRGVDSALTAANPVHMVRDYANNIGITVVMTGAQDIISNGKTTLLVDNGHPLMGGFSGSGCMAGSVIASFAGISKDTVDAASVGLASFGLCGERAAKTARSPFSLKQAIFDEMYNLTPAQLAKGAKIKKA
jgi:hydroxyethylthiazole kinase